MPMPKLTAGSESLTGRPTDEPVDGPKGAAIGLLPALQVLVGTDLRSALGHRLGLLLMALTTACSQTGGETPSTTTTAALPLGIAVAQTGNVSLLGQEQVAGARIAADYFNQQGGINGTPIKLVFQDTGGDEIGAINAFQTLITQNQVIGIVGPTLSQQAFSSNPIADRAKVPVLAPSNLAPGIPEIGEYIARISAPVDLISPRAVQAALQLQPQIKTVAVFYAQDQDGAVAEAKVFQRTAKQLGLQLVTEQKFLSTDTDFQLQASNGINAKPDLITISGLAADGGNLVRQLRELGFQGLILGGNGLNTSNLFPVCRHLCDGLLLAQAYNLEATSPINQVFRTAYQEKYRQDPPQLSAQAFAAVQVFVTALKAVDQTTKISSLTTSQLRTAVNQQLLAGKYETPIGKISFTPEGEIVQEQTYVAQIKMNPDGKQGKFIFLK